MRSSFLNWNLLNWLFINLFSVATIITGFSLTCSLAPSFVCTVSVCLSHSCSSCDYWGPFSHISVIFVIPHVPVFPRVLISFHFVSLILWPCAFIIQPIQNGHAVHPLNNPIDGICNVCHQLCQN